MNLREALHDAISGACTEDMAEHAEGSVVLTGWVMVAEWMDEDGDKHLERVWGPPDGITYWQRDGMLHEALYGKVWG